MIMLAFLNIATFILSFVFNIVVQYFPQVGGELETIIENFMLVLDKGVDLFCFLLGPVASVLVSYIIALQMVKVAWSLIWFVIRKIPMINIRE